MEVDTQYRRDPIPFLMMIHGPFPIHLKVIQILLLLVGWIGMVTSTTTTVTSGYYILNIFSESTCSIAASQQTFLLNVCYTSSTSGQYNIGVLQIDSNSFSSFTVTSSSSSASCTSLVTSGTNIPSSSYVGESCAYLSSGFYYSSTWSAYPIIVPATSTSNYAFPNGYIIKEYDDDACSSRLPRTTAFFISTSTCVPYRSSLNSVTTTYYLKPSCSSSALTLARYSDSTCSTLVSSRNVVSGLNCQSSSSTAVTSTSPSYSLFTCATYTYASGGYSSTQIYSDSSCSTLVYMSENNLNNQCFQSADSSAGYVTNVVQYYASDTSNTGVNSYTLSGSYTSSTCSTATTTLLSGGVSSPSYTSSCMQMVDAYSASISNTYVKYVIASSSQLPTSSPTVGRFVYKEYTDSSCGSSAGTSYYMNSGRCLSIPDSTNAVQYYQYVSCSTASTTATVNIYSDSTCTTLTSTAGVAVTAASTCSSESYSTTASPLFLSSGDAQYQKSTCVTATPTGQPSRQPSAQPSTQPSQQPTIRPSRQPSSMPSRQPSAQPSHQPSQQPTSQPTRVPTNQPTRQPSRQPTSQPSRQPSQRPSMQPTTQPSMQPSRQPSQQPTSQPSQQPTMQPTRFLPYCIFITYISSPQSFCTNIVTCYSLCLLT